MCANKRDRTLTAFEGPCFNSSSLRFDPSLMTDWLDNLRAENDRQRSTDNPEKICSFKHCVEYIFKASERFRLPDEAKYRAVGIFDRFLVQHIRDLYKHVRESNSKTKMHDWKLIVGRVKKQIPLRIVSCCQLASKLTAHYRVVSPKRAFAYLKELGSKYSINSILQSELRVLKTLDYNISLPCPSLYMEALLELIGRDVTDLQVSIIHVTSLKILDLIFLNFDEIYTELENAASGVSRQRKYLRNDGMLQAAGAIAASVYIMDQTKTDKIIELLSGQSGEPADGILDIATVILHQLYRENKKK
ncbi:hypothetical protein CAPTEDRAFT_213266 [Capitella teleta]|uniref:Cyclin N-terminal domain-containing protein n=1 Tax=Capitella teleta TaxID=283909 RepID=R7UQH7_CAPTE|nr:hypothetical protein CAPTEDRAFT_213266 [Capitella teleta]|eukprot:ELU08363.1 hypothetical protein CAPTEDRAFT_213266 [Capitella teleta]